MTFNRNELKIKCDLAQVYINRRRLMISSSSTGLNTNLFIYIGSTHIPQSFCLSLITI